MKKLSFLMAVCVSLAMFFSACDQQGGGKENSKLEIDTIGAEYASAMTIYNEGILADFYPGLAIYAYEGYTGTVEYDGHTLSGDGLVFQLMNAVSFSDKNAPIATSYIPMEAEGENITNIFPGGALPLSVISVVDGVATDQNVSTDFKVQILNPTSDKMIFAVEGNFEGEKMTFVFEGNPTIKGGAFTTEDVETEEVFNGDVEFTSAEIVYFGDQELLDVNPIEVILISKDNTTFADFYCYGSLDDPKNVYGTYEVSNEYKVGTMTRSYGVNLKNGYVFPSFITRNFDAQTESGDYYLVDGGSLTIEDGKISFKLKTLNGSNINAVFEGKISLKSADEVYGAPQARARAMKNVKKIQPLNYNNTIKLF